MAWMLSIPLFAACSKDLPSSPGAPAGTPVYLQVEPIQQISRDIHITARVVNQSGRTIYDVRLGMTVYLDDPVFAYRTDTSEVKLDLLQNGEVSRDATFQMSGDQFIDAFAVWTYIPPPP